MGHFKQLVLWVHSRHKWASRKLIQLQQFREYNPLQVWLLIATLPPTPHGTSDKSSLLSKPPSSHWRALELLCKAGCDVESENWASSLARPLRSGVTLAITSPVGGRKIKELKSLQMQLDLLAPQDIISNAECSHTHQNKSNGIRNLMYDHRSNSTAAAMGQNEESQESRKVQMQCTANIWVKNNRT